MKHHDHEDHHCGCNSCGCCDASHEACHHHHHHSKCHSSTDYHDFAHKLIEMADQAWMEVLQEKIREQVRAMNGKHLDELAKQVAEANNERWKLKMAVEKGCHGFKEKISQFFSSK